MPFELVLWENAVYLLPDQRRAAVFDALRAQVGLTPDAILHAPTEVLLPLATLGGMRPETRVDPLAGNRPHHRHSIPGQPGANPSMAACQSHEGAETLP